MDPETQGVALGWPPSALSAPEPEEDDAAMGYEVHPVNVLTLVVSWRSRYIF
jgi:hypothetical protein